MSCIAKSVVSSFFCSHRSEFNNICFHYRKFQEILFSFQQVRSTVGLIQGETLIPDHPDTISTSSSTLSCMIWRIELGSCQETNQQVTNFITNKQWSIARVMALWDNAIISIMNPFGVQQFPTTSIFLHDSFEMNWNYCKNFITIPFQSPCQYSVVPAGFIKK